MNTLQLYLSAFVAFALFLFVFWAGCLSRSFGIEALGFAGVFIVMVVVGSIYGQAHHDEPLRQIFPKFAAGALVASIAVVLLLAFIAARTGALE